MAPNKFIKFSVIVFIVGGLILFFGKGEWFPDFYNPKFMGIIGLVSGLLIIFPRLIFKNSMIEVVPQSSEKTLNFLQNSLAFVLLLNAAGALGLFQLYKIGFEYDKFLHFIVPAISVIAIAYFNYHWYGIKLSKSIILSMIIVVLIGFLWEMFEVFGDWAFKTQMLGYYGKFITEDTFWDLIINILGVASGAIVSMIKIK